MTPELHSHPHPQPLATRLREIAQLFLKLGCIGFGGPQAHIAMINDEAVVRRGWLTQEQFTDGLAVCEMLPGPASTQMGIYTGYQRAGQLGALVAGLCFIAPAFLIIVAMSWAYFTYQGVPQIDALFLGVSPVVVAIILAFCWTLSRKTLNQPWRWAIALTVFLVTLLAHVNVLLQFIIAGLISWLITQPAKPTSPSASTLWLPALPLTLAQLSSTPLTVASFWGWERIQHFALPLAVFFLKVGAFVFGGGLVIIPLLESEVVQQFGWLTRDEFINGVALGQLTPGPVVLTAAFVGYKVAGVLGALVATIAIFTPSFAFIMLAAPLLHRLRQNPQVKRFLTGVMPAVLGAIAAAVVPMARSALVQESWVASVGAVAIAIAALITLLRLKPPTWQLVLAGAVLGFGIQAIASVTPPLG